MGQEWDKLTTPTRTWEAGGGFSRPGIGARQTDWPSYSATSLYGAANPTCAECGGRLRGAKKCACPKPHDHWKPIGKRRTLPQDTATGIVEHLRAISEWHRVWLLEAYRVLEPGGYIGAFSGTRVLHHLAQGMEAAGFRDIRIEAWCYGSGFPKSLNISKSLDKQWGRLGNHFKEGIEGIPQRDVAHSAEAWDGWGTALKPAWEPVVIGRKPCL